MDSGHLVRTILSLLTLLFSVSFLATFAAASEPQLNESEVAFQWAFTAITEIDGKTGVIPVTGDMTLKTGDQLKMMLSFDTDCFIYLVYRSSTGEIVRLFPYEFVGVQKESRTNQRFFFPDANNWYTLDDTTGTEKFYLLASSVPLKTLEELLSHYENASLPSKPEIADQITLHINILRKSNSQLDSVAERPIQIGGNFRSIAPKQQTFYDISKYAVSITRNTFYARTYTIEHK